jgi:hypothetical protein
MGDYFCPARATRRGSLRRVCSLTDVTMPVTGYVAMVLGFVFSVILGAGCLLAFILVGLITAGVL